MTERAVHLHRVLRAPPERIYRAFLEPDALAKWLPPRGFTCQVHQLDARVGGQFRMSFRNFGKGLAHTFGGEPVGAAAAAPGSPEIPTVIPALERGLPVMRNFLPRDYREVEPVFPLKG